MAVFHAMNSNGIIIIITVLAVIMFIVVMVLVVFVTNCYICNYQLMLLGVKLVVLRITEICFPIHSILLVFPVLFLVRLFFIVILQKMSLTCNALNYKVVQVSVIIIVTIYCNNYDIMLIFSYVTMYAHTLITYLNGLIQVSLFTFLQFVIDHSNIFEVFAIGRRREESMVKIGLKKRTVKNYVLVPACAKI